MLIGGAKSSVEAHAIEASKLRVLGGAVVGGGIWLGLKNLNLQNY
jgi:hypothetical protein